MIDLDPGHAHNGNNSFAGGAIGAPGFISQNIATIPGRSYNIHLWLANFSGFLDGTELQVLWNGSLVYDQIDIIAPSYVEIVIDPPAFTPITLLSLGLRDDSFFLNVDDISVRLVAEPASLALLGAGFAGLGFARRRKFA